MRCKKTGNGTHRGFDWNMPARATHSVINRSAAPIAYTLENKTQSQHKDGAKTHHPFIMSTACLQLTHHITHVHTRCQSAQCRSIAVPLITRDNR